MPETQAIIEQVALYLGAPENPISEKILKVFFVRLAAVKCDKKECRIGGFDRFNLRRGNLRLV